jgi:uncharacterized 2Fe-2S/4Fe-4S cluster protein (DUF4445 family)
MKNAAQRLPTILAPIETETGVLEPFINQKDIRHIPLGKSALITGINALLKTARQQEPSKIIVTGAFGAHLNKYDLLTLGMLPAINPERIYCAGNGAGAGAAMALCNDGLLQKFHEISTQTTVLNLVDDSDFQMLFVRNLAF